MHQPLHGLFETSSYINLLKMGDKISMLKFKFYHKTLKIGIRTFQLDVYLELSGCLHLFSGWASDRCQFVSKTVKGYFPEKNWIQGHII